MTTDLKGVITSWNKAAERLFGYAASEIIGKPVSTLIPPDRQNEDPRILACIRGGERVGHYETVRRQMEASSRSPSPSRLLRTQKGQLTGASKIARDITERKRFEETQALLLREMHHRVKNLFAVASSIVALSAPEAATPAALAQIVQHRLLALARAHELTLTNPGSVALAGTRPGGLHSLTRESFYPFRSERRGGALRHRGA